MATVGENLIAVVEALRSETRTGLEDVVRALREPGGGSGGGSGGGGSGPASAPAASKLSDALDKFAGKATRATVALTGFTVVFDKLMSSMGQQMTRFVSLANPAAVMRFNIALENAMSALGRVFLPVLERFTVMIQAIGNAIESLSPQAKALIAGLTVGGGLAAIFAAGAAAAALLIKTLGSWVGLIALVGSAVLGVITSMGQGREIMAAFSAVLKTVGTIVEALTEIFVVTFLPVINLLAVAIRHVANFITDLIRWVAELVGLQLPDFNPSDKQAQAVRQSRITTLKEFANRAYTMAFGGAGQDPQKMILTENQKQTKLLEKIANRATPGQFASDIANRPLYTMGRIARGAGQTFGDAIQWTRDRMRSIFE